MVKIFSNVSADIAWKCRDYYEECTIKKIFKTLLTEGTLPVLIFRLANFFFNHGFFPVGWFLKMINGMVFGIVIGPKLKIGPGFCIAHANGIVIHRYAVIGNHFRIQHQVTIGQRNDKVPIIGNNVYCGCGSKILGGITIGDNVKIGANAVVVHDVPPNCTVVGIPARIVKQAEPDLYNQ
jgi:serine O-acetyltransferase